MNPVLIRFSDSFYIGTYGALVAIGLLAGVLLAAWRLKQKGDPPELAFDLTFVAVLSGFLGGRVAFIITEWSLFMENPAALIFSRDGFVFLGGLIGGVACSFIYLAIRGIAILPFADVMIPSVALGHAFGRLGCHFAGCCFGSVCTLPGAGLTVPRLEQPDGTLFYNAFSDQLWHGDVEPDALASLPVWPTQLYEAGGLFVLTAILLWVASKTNRTGAVFALYLVLYAILRFGIEMLRGDEARGLHFGGLLSTSQILSILLLPIAAGVWWWGGKFPKWGERPAPPSKSPAPKRKRYT
jgi:phosphatidylglycerol---prolipoprotein diacylglyceryl transferase